MRFVHVSLSCVCCLRFVVRCMLLCVKVYLVGRCVLLVCCWQLVVCCLIVVC